jgi:hypothetical protein
VDELFKRGFMLTEDIIFQQSKEIKQGLTDLAISLAPTHNIDFVFNQDRSIEGTRKDLNRFLMRVETNMLGKFFYRKPADERIKSICFVEHIETNIHYHGLLHIPQHFHDRFTIKAIKAWLKICPSGSLKITPIPTEPEIFIKSNYAHKEIYKLQNYENFVLHSEFWSFKK